MQRTAGLVFVVLLSGCWRNAPSVTQSPPAVASTPSAPVAPEASYRDVTMALDATAIGLLAASTVAYSQRGGNDPLAVGLLLAGGAAMLGVPVVHAAHGNGSRAGASYLFRSIFVTAGAAVGMEVGCAHHPGFLCGLGPELGWGTVGGLAVAGALDALLLHGWASTWTPTLMPSGDGARVGIARTF